MRTYLYEILKSEEFKKYCKEQGIEWKRKRPFKIQIVREGKPLIEVFNIHAFLTQGCMMKIVDIGEGKTLFKKYIYKYKRDPLRIWAIEQEIETEGYYYYKYETFDDLARKIQKAWRRTSSALTLQRWWKSVYYAPGGQGYFRARGSYVKTCQKFSSIK